MLVIQGRCGQLLIILIKFDGVLFSKLNWNEIDLKLNESKIL